jgi:hypothetical protein
VCTVFRARRPPAADVPSTSGVVIPTGPRSLRFERISASMARRSPSRSSARCRTALASASVGGAPDMARARDKEAPVEVETAVKGRTRREVGRGALWNAERGFRCPSRGHFLPCNKRVQPSLPAPAITTDGIPPPPPTLSTPCSAPSRSRCCRRCRRSRRCRRCCCPSSSPCPPSSPCPCPCPPCPCPSLAWAWTSCRPPCPPSSSSCRPPWPSCCCCRPSCRRACA